MSPGRRFPPASNRRRLADFRSRKFPVQRDLLGPTAATRHSPYFRAAGMRRGVVVGAAIARPAISRPDPFLVGDCSSRPARWAHRVDLPIRAVLRHEGKEVVRWRPIRRLGEDVTQIGQLLPVATRRRSPLRSPSNLCGRSRKPAGFHRASSAGSLGRGSMARVARQARLNPARCRIARCWFRWCCW
jgi:hypothetical protein